MDAPQTITHVVHFQVTLSPRNAGNQNITQCVVEHVLRLSRSSDQRRHLTATHDFGSEVVLNHESMRVRM